MGEKVIDDAEDIHEAETQHVLRELWASWMNKYAAKMAIAITCMVFGFIRRDLLIVLLGAGFLLQPIGGAISLSNLSSRARKFGRGLVAVGRIAFLILCVALLLRELSKMSAGSPGL